jgi:hypothetical protein
MKPLFTAQDFDHPDFGDNPYPARFLAERTNSNLQLVELIDALEKASRIIKTGYALFEGKLAEEERHLRESTKWLEKYGEK